MATKKKKILHQHLIKCGGTTLNAFLGTQYNANKVHDSIVTRLWKEPHAITTDNVTEKQEIYLNIFSNIY